MAKIYLETYGCTLNQADSDILRAIILERNSLTDRESESDVIILNTCTVKGATENKILERIRKLETERKKTQNPKLVIAGCLSVNEDRIRRISPKVVIVSTSSLSRINDAIDDAMAGRAASYNAGESKDALPRIFTAPIARIPINDGCISRCNFCQTRLARPYLRSSSPKAIVKWINEAVRNGAREIQLTSQDCGAYGLDIKTDLIRLLDAIIDDDSSTRADQEFLIRLGMINPDHAKRMLPGIIRALKHPRLYKFIHIPVQSGSEKVCKEMNRDHTVKDFVDIVEAVRKEIPSITIATDIIVGYPTETEEDFQKTLHLLERTKPDIINISKFTPRPFTPAKEMKQLQNKEIKRRSEVISVLVKRITLESNRCSIGKVFRVLVCEKSRDFKGRTMDYKQVVLKDFAGRLGDFTTIKITDANHGSLFCKGGSV